MFAKQAPYVVALSIFLTSTMTARFSYLLFLLSSSIFFVLLQRVCVYILFFLQFHLFSHLSLELARVFIYLFFGVFDVQSLIAVHSSPFL